MAATLENLTVNGWDIRNFPKPALFKPEEVAQGLDLIAYWRQLFPKEGTWARQELGIPSLIIRMDCTITDNGRLGLYEIEERPAGLGVCSKVNPQFRNKLQALMETWPDFTVVISPKRSQGDDYLWTSPTSFDIPSNGLVLVRAEPEETEFHFLESRSISSVQAKGNKSYGVAMGLWTLVTEPEDLPWDECFIVKPTIGSKCRNIEIWDPSKRMSGCSTRTRIERTLREFGRMYCQPFLLPLASGLEECPWMIFRVFYGYDIARKEWQCLGGCWMARNNMKIHGARDSIVGPLVV